ncbi:MAG TPA: hypothetical protein VFF65_09435 [Phycisphaerales bacterium]|nr:hypothetical protein [Phycisphaerales bacterium]
MDRCEGCKRKLDGRWLCDDCSPYFDGDRVRVEDMPDKLRREVEKRKRNGGED